MRNKPTLFVTTGRTVAVAGSVAVTVAPGSAAPVLSRTVPVRVPVPWASASGAPARQITATRKSAAHVRDRVTILHTPCARQRDWRHVNLRGEARENGG